MTASLSFRKESIQRSSNASEAMGRVMAESREGQGLKHAGDRWYPTLTTSLTTVQ